jgi:hypothetical protein
MGRNMLVIAIGLLLVGCRSQIAALDPPWQGDA